MSSVVPVKNRADEGWESKTSVVWDVAEPSNPSPNNPSISWLPDLTISAAWCAPVPCPEREMWFSANIPCDPFTLNELSSLLFSFHAFRVVSIPSQPEVVTKVMYPHLDNPSCSQTYCSTDSPSSGMKTTIAKGPFWAIGVFWPSETAGYEILYSPNEFSPSSQPMKPEFTFWTGNCSAKAVGINKTTMRNNTLFIPNAPPRQLIWSSITIVKVNDLNILEPRY